MGGGTPPLLQSRPEKLAQPFEKAQNRLGSCGRPKPRPGRSPCRPWSARNAGWGVAVVCGRTRVSRGLGGGAPLLRQSRPEKPAQAIENAQNRLGTAGGRSRERVDRLAVFAQLETQAGRRVGPGRARVSRALGGGTPSLRQSRPEKPAQALENAQNRLGSGGRPKPRPGCAPGRSPCRPWSARNAGWASQSAG